MSLEDKIREKLGKKKAAAPEVKTITRIREITMPKHIQTAWEDLYPSIASAFSLRKWPTKNNMLSIFNDWIESLPKE